MDTKDNQFAAAEAIQNSDSNPLLDHPIHYERHIRIICIGAGASGLLLAYKLQRDFGNFSLRVYEKNAGVSGTWFENRYPGCACDIISHNYTYSFEPNPKWSSVYAKADEINKYFTNFMLKYQLDKYCKTGHEVLGARWDDTRGTWNLEIKNLATGRTVQDSCDILVNAGGSLNHWKWPSIPGLKDFKGPLLHTANYDQSINLVDKRVGLIGNGASGIQVLPAVQPDANTLFHFIRQPTWTTTPWGPEAHEYTKEEQASFSNEPGKLLALRKFHESALTSMFGILIAGSPSQKHVRDFATKTMQTKLLNPDLESKLIPSFGIGCRRPTPGINYLDAVTKENVKVVCDKITKVTPTGFVTDTGDQYSLDVIICATGFNQSYRPRFPIIGQDGKNLQDVWDTEPKGYLALAAPYMPNYFTFVGPYNSIASGPLLAAIEHQADYMLKFCSRLQTESIHRFTPKLEAIEEFVAHTAMIMSRTVWADDCRSVYKGNTSNPTDLRVWPGSSHHYIEAIADIRYDDWDIKYRGNRFSFLGNGFSQTETDLTCDWAYYITDTDSSLPLSRSQRRKQLTYSGTRDASKSIPGFGQINTSE